MQEKTYYGPEIRVISAEDIVITGYEEGERREKASEAECATVLIRWVHEAYAK